MKKKKSLFGRRNKGYSGSVKCNACGKILKGNRVGAMCEKCYTEKIGAPNTREPIAARVF